MKVIAALFLALLMIVPACATDTEGLSVTCIGDSLTEGVIERGGGLWVDSDSSYPSVLARLLNVPVRNFGSSGAVASEESPWFCWRRRADKYGFDWLTPASSRPVYVLYLGINDISHRGELTGDVPRSLQDRKTFVGGYAAIIEQIQEKLPEAEIFLVTLGPEMSLSPSYSSSNRKIRDIARQYGCHVVSWDQICTESELPLWRQTFLSKAPHLNQDGYSLLASCIRDAILQVLS